jgi:hypothetical protein
MSIPTHSPESALRFLRVLYPEGPWVLTAIEVDRQGITTQTFRPDNEDLVRVFLLKQDTRNVYYHLNKPRRDLTSKASKLDVAAAHFLHVDVDPRAADRNIKPEKHFAAERERIKTLLESPPAPIPRPTACVFSGGGFNALWRLADPYVLDGDPERIDQLERYNRQLEWALGGDNCHNVDRILRLPGTINWPDARKRAKGRLSERAELLWFDDTTHALSDFTPATTVQTPSDGFSAALPNRGEAPDKQRARITGNVRRLADVRELGDLVRNHVKVIIVQGNDPTGDHTFPSRSETLFYVCCELVRANITDDVIYSVITDQDFAISASVLDKGAGAERYAIRQIERAREESVHPLLRQFNEAHAVVENIGGKCRVIEEINDPVLNRPLLTMQSFDDFRNRYLNKRVRVGTTKDGNAIVAPAGKWWLEHESRRQFRTIVFAPEREAAGAYNLWRGFAIEARPGNGHESFLRHIHDHLCAGVENVYRYLLGWMAYAVQHPARPGEVAVVLRGKKGVGKSFTARVFGSLFGRHYMAVSDAKHIVGNFNAHLRDCVVLFGDEAFWAGDKKHESVLKMLITEESIAIEPKGVDVQIVPNYVHLIMASNAQWVVPAGADERRFLVLDVAPTKIQDSVYFGGLRAELDGGGLSNLLYFLKTYPLDQFEVRTVPKTEALQYQKILSLESHEEWWFRKLEDGILLPDHVGWSEPVMKDALIDDYLEYAQRVGGARRTTATGLSRFIERVIPPNGPRIFQAVLSARDGGLPKRDKANFWRFPDLDMCRQGFDAECGGPYPWPTIEVIGSLNAAEPF